MWDIWAHLFMFWLLWLKISSHLQRTCYCLFSECASLKKPLKVQKKSLLVDMAVKGGPCPLRKVFVEGEKNLKILKFLFRKLVFVHDKKTYIFAYRSVKPSASADMSAIRISRFFFEWLP